MKSKLFKLLGVLTLVAVGQRVALADDIINPLGSTNTIGGVIAKIVGSLYLFAIPISSLFILWGAFQIMMSSGETEKIAKGRKTIIYAVVGLVIMVFASGVGYIITNVLSGA